MFGWELALAITGVCLMLLGIFLDIDFADGWLSIVVLGAFLSIFGFASYALDSSLQALGISVLLAFAAATSTRFLFKKLDTHYAEETTSLAVLKGQLVKVISPIASNSLGQVKCMFNDSPLILSASSENEDFNIGDEALIISVVSPTQVLVKRI